MKILRNRAASFGDDGLQLFSPKSWGEMTQDQLRYALTVLATFEPTSAKVYMICRFSGLHIIKRTYRGWECFVRTGLLGRRKFVFLQTWQIQSFLEQMKFVDTYEGMGVRLDSIHGFRAVDILLHNVAFIDYLNIEKYYQLYLMNSGESQLLLRIANILYRDRRGHAAKIGFLDSAEQTGIFLWFSYIKSEFSKQFPHFFRPIAAEDVQDYDLIGSINAQIRALTDGDITKESIIFNMDCWRALTELDQKAREAEEFKAKYGNK